LVWLLLFYYRSPVIVIPTHNTILLLVYLLELFSPNINFLCTTISIFFLYTLFHNFTSLIHGSHYLFDLTTRLDFNDSFVNLFNFFWTSFTYLPSFFFLILLQLILQKSSIHTVYNIPVLLTLYYVYNTELVDFIILNYHLEVVNHNYSSINLLLTNSLNKYHPFIFYVSVILFIYLFSHLFSHLFFNFKLFSLNYSYKQTITGVQSVLLYNLFALFLGSWWALQEGTWGGWWNWDPSEVLGLLFSLFALFVTHSSTNQYLMLLWFYRITISMCITIIAYLFIQLNFDLVSHNFGSKFFFFFNNNLFFLEALLFLIFYTFITSFKTQRHYLESATLLSIRKIDRFKDPNFWYDGSFIILLTIALLVLNSMMPLINYFVWTYCKINSFNFLVHNTNLIFIISLLMLTPFYITALPQNYLTVFLLGFNSFSYILTLLTSVKRSNTLISQLHLIIITFLVVNIYSYSLTFIYWIITGNCDDIYSSNYTMFQLYNTWHCNSSIVEISASYTSNTTFNVTSWNVFYHYNSNSLNNFLLLVDALNFYNYYNLLDNYHFINLFIETNMLNNLIEIFTWLFSYLITILFLKKSKSNHF